MSDDSYEILGHWAYLLLAMDLAKGIKEHGTGWVNRRAQAMFRQNSWRETTQEHVRLHVAPEDGPARIYAEFRKSVGDVWVAVGDTGAEPRARILLYRNDEPDLEPMELAD